MIELLESRIAPATVVVHSLSDIVTAINDAGSGDVVKFAAKLKGTVTINDAFTIANDVKIIGNGKVTFQSDGTDRFFNFTASETTVMLKGLVMKGGVSDQGGAILSSANLKLIGCTFEGNQSTGDGGAIEVAGGSLTAVKSKFINNQGTALDSEGGAIYALGGTSVTVNKSRFLSNSAASGGAIADGSVNSVQFNIVKTKFEQNTATDAGGAIYSDGNDTLTIKKSRFENNVSNGSYGALLASGNGIVTISKTKFRDNSAVNSGGAIGLLDGTATISRTLITSNTASDANGGGIYTTADSLIIQKSRIVKNTAGDTGGGIYDVGPENNLSVNEKTVKNNSAPVAPNIFHLTPP